MVELHNQPQTALERIAALEADNAAMKEEVAQLRTILQEWMLIGETIVEYSQEHTVH